MLKLQDDYTTLIATFEDFILLVYTIIDDLYQQFVPASVSQRRNVDTAKMSDPEIITLSICGELAADHTLTKTFLRMGVDELSVPPWEILPLRKLIRALDLSRPPVSSDSGGRGQFPAWGAAPELRDPPQKAIRSR